ncbi:MAG: M42 family metallopeptidase [Chloroflexi bacterium]|nr:M42 family metallopeptidase [Chloroflexota bacterium]
MNKQEQRALDILAGLAKNPAAPFHEWGVAEHILGVLATLEGVEYGRDAFGNIIARYTSPSIAALPESEREPPIAFVAHMDHPGYEIVRPADAPDAESGGKRYVAQALGGVPVASMTKNTPAFVLMPDGERISAEIRPLNVDSSDGGGERLVNVRVESDAELPMPAPVVFDLPDFGIDGDTIRMRAADDLAGCGAILSALEQLVTSEAEADFIAVFTRAEEGGLFGARLMAEAGTLPEDTLVVSVETSSIIPGVEQGEGPVIRTGDRVYTFDADAEQVFSAALQTIRAADSEFKAQRQLMSGGGCEATAFAVFGYTVTGLAFPLGNWHNATTTIPDPDGGVDSEYISVSDYLGGVALMAEAGVSVGKRHDSPTRQYIREIPDDVRERMRETAGD